MDELYSCLLPIQTDKIRIGPSSDGGYVLGKNYLSKKVYSYGVGTNIRFEESYLSLYPDTVICLFDGTIDSLPNTAIVKHPNAKFYQHNVYHEDDLHIEGDDCLVMMDIEGSEIELLSSMTESTFDKIKQICVEVHLNKRLDLRDSIRFFQTINRYFHLVHIHANNHKHRLYFGVPSVLELTYINKKYFKESVIVEKKGFPIKDLDFPNVKNKKDFKIDWWIK